MDFVTNAFTYVKNPNLTITVPGGHVAHSLIQAFYGADYIHSATGIILMEARDARVVTVEYRMGSMQRPWGLPLPYCGFGCGQHGISIFKYDDTVQFRCSCGASAGMDKPEKVENVRIPYCPGIYMFPFPWQDVQLDWKR